jgi:hypothetical protein
VSAANRREHREEAIGPRAVERFLGDAAILYGWRLPELPPRRDTGSSSDGRRGSHRRIRRVERALRGAPRPVVRQLLPMRQLLRVCPDAAVSKLGPEKRYAFDYDFCKGCGICVAECPCGAIVMVPELI